MRSLFGRREEKGQVEQDYTQCSPEHGDHTFRRKRMASEAFLSASLTWCHGGLGQVGLVRGSSVDKQNSKGVKGVCKGILSVMCDSVRVSTARWRLMEDTCGQRAMEDGR